MITFKAIMDDTDFEAQAKEDMEKLTCLIDTFFEKVRESSPELVEKTLMRIALEMSETLPYHCAIHAVEKMTNGDGTTGQHWDYVTTSSVLKTKGYTFTEADWYYVLNMMYSDYYCKDYTDDDYIKLAYQFLNDKDAPKDKAKRYYIAMNF